MPKFAYAYADVTEATRQSLYQMLLDADPSVSQKNDYHITLCFDATGSKLKAMQPYPAVYRKIEHAVIDEVVEWSTQKGERILVAKLRDCEWTKRVNEWYCNQGIVEDLPHVPHVTLIKPFLGEVSTFKHLEGMSLCFSEPTGSWLQ